MANQPKKKPPMQDAGMEKPHTSGEAVAAIKVHLHSIVADLARTVRWRSLATAAGVWAKNADEHRRRLRREAEHG